MGKLPSILFAFKSCALALGASLLVVLRSPKVQDSVELRTHNREYIRPFLGIGALKLRSKQGACAEECSPAPYCFQCAFVGTQGTLPNLFGLLAQDYEDESGLTEAHWDQAWWQYRTTP